MKTRITHKKVFKPGGAGPLCQEAYASSTFITSGVNCKECLAAMEDLRRSKTTEIVVSYPKKSNDGSWDRGMHFND